jgi:GT2 family glycosyltransferase
LVNNLSNGNNRSNHPPIEIISATRLSDSDFWQNSPLGISLRRIQHDDRFSPQITFLNQRGLPEIYNAGIAAAASNQILVFVHDDVWIDDYFLVDRVMAGLQAYDVIGVAGNRRRVAAQTAWAFIDRQFSWDDRANLSGSIAHGPTPFGQVAYFGAIPAECELLDGVFFAAKAATLVATGVMFDQQFDFHFYDMDFCRSARQSGLRLGTWPICLTHQSGGAFGTPKWIEKYHTYIQKWGN